MIKIDKIKKSIYFLNINYMLHYNNNTHQIINAIIMMSRTQYNYIDELNGFINDALDYEDEEDTTILDQLTIESLSVHTS